MKLIDFLDEKLSLDPSILIDDKIDIFKIKDELFNCDEFIDVFSPEILENNYLCINNTIIKTTPLIISDETKFTGFCFLYEITIAPKVYDHKILYNTIKNGGSISPVLYGLNNLECGRRMIIDIPLVNIDKDIDDDIRKRLHNLVDDILDNPNEYKIKCNKNRYILNGVFEYVDISGKKYTEIINIE